MTGLNGKTVVITRARERAAEFTKCIEQYGGIPVIFPAIEILPPESWDACNKALDNFDNYDGLVFTSANAVRSFFGHAEERKALRNGYRKKFFLAVGEKTKRSLSEFGIDAAQVPEHFSARDLARSLREEDVKGKQFLFPCGDISLPTIAEEIHRMEGAIDSVVVYRTVKPDESAAEQFEMMLREGKIDCITFTSPSTATNFFSMIDSTLLKENSKKVLLAAIGNTTAAAIGETGFHAGVVASESTIEGLTRSIAEYYDQSR
jgi:uroporphyrinogen III methyltransferase/synthase